MTNIKIYGTYHHKNQKGLEMICNHLNYKIITSEKNTPDIIMCPAYRNIKNFKKVIYGPHFSVFPDNRSLNLKQGIYIQPSEWVIKNVWSDFKNIPIYSFPFPVETEKFKPVKENRDLVLVYYKRRDPTELNYLKNFLTSKNIDYKLFNYLSRYSEQDYINSLQNAKYMVFLGRHESQGFALQEALSCNIPLLVWEVKYMSQEHGYNYPDIPSTVIPYWDERCGEFFFEKEELENTYQEFIKKLDTYKPRDFILENLSVEKCSERFKNLINNL